MEEAGATPLSPGLDPGQAGIDIMFLFAKTEVRP